jgi:hypothetical protein cdivTM_08694
MTSKENILSKWRTISSRTIFEYSRLTVVEDIVKLPNGNIISYIHYPYCGYGGVIVVCRRGDTILVQQEYSYPVDEVLYQLPGGKIEVDEDACAAARRELAEESGVAMNNLRECGWFYPDNRRTDAKLHVVYGEYAGVDYQHQPDDTEQIISQWLPIADVQSMIDAGKITNYAMLAAWAIVDCQLFSRKNRARR